MSVGDNAPVSASYPWVVTIIGPTASGKSDLSLELAHALNGEVINADSMQVYRGMDIGTAKLPPEQRRGVPHHLLDLWKVTDAAHVADYQQRARAAVLDITERGRIPVVVGGSGLYVRAVLDDLQFPGTDPAVRARLQAECDEHGASAMHARLARLDPAAAAAILPTNARRIVRALEVLELTGEQFLATLPTPVTVVPSVTIGLRISRDVLDVRIAQRVDQMWEQGFVNEVHTLRAQGLEQGVTASKALGYAQILEALRTGNDPDSAREPTIFATRRFARRQWSWFERDAVVQWRDWDDPHLVAHISDLWGQRETVRTP